MRYVKNSVDLDYLTIQWIKIFDIYYIVWTFSGNIMVSGLRFKIQ